MKRILGLSVAAAMGITVAVVATPFAPVGADDAVPFEPTIGQTPASVADPIEPPTGVSAQAGYTSVTPARLVDTRPDQTTVDGDDSGAGKLDAAGTHHVQVGGRGGVPSSAGAAILNVTVINPEATGYLTVFPFGSEQPLASSLNYSTGSLIASQVTVPLDDKGRVSVYSHAATHLVVDVVGWIDGDAEGDILVPARIVDSRAGQDTIDGAMAGFGALGAERTVSVDVLGRGGVPASGVGAVIVSVVAVKPTATGYLTVFPDGAAQPTTSSLNHEAGGNVNRQVVVKLGDSGRFNIFSFAQTDVVVDVVGWLPEEADLIAVTPSRIVDTRPDGDTIDGRYAAEGRVAAGVPIDVEVGERAGVPANAGAVILNVTAVNPSANGYVTVFPNGEDLPVASSVNFRAGDIAGNQVMVRVGRHDTIRIYSSADAHLVVDLVAWSLPGINQPLNNVQTLMEYSPAIAPITGGPGTGGATFTVPEGADVRVDDIVVFETPDDLPYYGKVTTINGDEATSTEVTLGEVIPSGSFEFEADAETGVIEESSFVEQTAGDIPPADPADSLLDGIETEASKSNMSCSAGGSADVEFEYYVDLLKFQTKAEWGIFGVDMSFAYTPTIGFDAEGTVEISGSCKLSIPLAEKDLKTIKFAVAGIPIVITQDLSLSLEVSLGAETEITISTGATVSAKIGLGFNGSLYVIKDFNLKRRIAVNQQSEVKLSVALPVTYSAALYGVVGLDLTASPTITATLAPDETKWLKVEAHVDLAAAAFVQFKISIDLFFTDIEFDWKTSFKLAEGTVWGPKEIYSRSRTDVLTPLTSAVPAKGALSSPYAATFSIPKQPAGYTMRWSAPGLPPGLTLTPAADGQSARIHGIPTTIGVFAFGVDVDIEPANFTQNPSYATGQFTLDVAKRFAATTQLAAVGEVDRPFKAVANATGGVGPYTWTATNLPAGVSLVAATTSTPIAHLSGTPTVDGTGTATITGKDAKNSTVTISLPWSVAAKISISAPTFPSGGTGVAYSQSFTINGGAEPIVHTITGIPFGMTSVRSGRTVTISGAPQIARNNSVRLRAVSEQFGVADLTRYFTVRASMRYASNTVSLPVGLTPIQPGDGWLTVIGGTGPYTWSVGNLPTGVTFDTDQDGSRVRFFGSMENPGAVPVTVTVADSTGAPAPSAQVIVRAAESTNFDTTGLPDAAIGAAYATDIVVSGGRAPYRWSARGIPAGVELVAGATEGTYRLVGTPTGPAGNYRVEFTVGDDTTRRPAVSEITLVVAPALTLAAGDLPNGAVGSTYTPTAAIEVEGGVAPFDWTVTGLPAGVSLDTNTTGARRTFTGAPTATGTSTVEISVTDAGGSTAATGSRTITVAPALTASAAGLPAKAYTYADVSGTATSTGGNAPITFSATGLPTGVTMSTTGALSGRPTTSGTSAVTVTATDSVGYTADANFSLQSITPIVPDVSGAPTALATGERYTGSVTATGGVAPYTYTIRNTAGTLPGFIDLDDTTGVFGTNTPATAAGTYPLEVTVADSDGRSETATYTLVVAATAPITVTPILPTDATNGTAITGSASATGGIAPYTWALTSAPTWMSINATTGAISGTPTGENGPVSVTIQATGGIFVGTSTVSIDVRAPIAINTALLPVTGAAGDAFTGTVTWTGGRDVTMAVTGLPTTLTDSTSGSTMTISGRPLAGGTHNLVFTATDAAGRTATANVAVVIAAADALVIDDSTLPTSVTLTSPTAQYAGTATVAGGVTPYTWEITGLPAGVTHTTSGATATFSGRPAATGSFTVTLKVTDAAGTETTSTVGVTITLIELAVDTSDLWAIGHNGINETLGTVTATGGVAPYSFAATNLPPGLSINAITGVVSGTATSNGTRNVTITVTDSSSTPLTATAIWNVTVRAAIPIAAPNLPTEFSTTVFIPIKLPGYTGAAPTITTSARLPNGTTSTNMFTCVAYATDYGCFGEPTVAGLTLDVFVENTGTGAHGAWRGTLELSQSKKTQISVGLDYGCALYADTTIRCWGSNDAGQLGNANIAVGTTSFDPVPVTDAAGVELTGWTRVEANANAAPLEAFTCGLKQGAGGREVWCWGAGTFGQLGNGASLSSPTPVQVLKQGPSTNPTNTSTLRYVSDLVVGGRQACAASNDFIQPGVTANVCWGESTPVTGSATVVNYGSLRYAPISGSFNGIPKLGGRHACFNESNNVCFGPTDLIARGTNPDRVNVWEVGRAGGHSSIDPVGRVSRATVWDAVGPLNYNSAFTYRMTAGHSHTCMLYAEHVDDGEVLCWGDNDKRQIGSTSTSNHSMSTWAVDVDPSYGSNHTNNDYQTRFAYSGPTGTFDSIDAGGDVTCGIRNNTGGEGIACWGEPYVAAATPNTATLVTTDDVWASISVGPNHACALKTSGLMKCWGANDKGQLGLGSNILASGNVLGQHLPYPSNA